MPEVTAPDAAVDASAPALVAVSVPAAPVPAGGAPTVLETYAEPADLEGVLTRGESVDLNRLAATIVNQMRLVAWLLEREMPRYEADLSTAEVPLAVEERTHDASDAGAEPKKASTRATGRRHPDAGTQNRV